MSFVSSLKIYDFFYVLSRNGKALEPLDFKEFGLLFYVQRGKSSVILVFFFLSLFKSDLAQYKQLKKRHFRFKYSFLSKRHH